MMAPGTTHTIRANSVVARFPDCVLAFEMPRGATFGELAERLASFEERMDEMPLSIAVRPAL